MRLLVSGTTKTMQRLLPDAADVLGYLVTPGAGNRVQGMADSGLPWAADNGAFSGFDPERFRHFLGRVRLNPGCLFLAVPDVVADARATLARFREWAEECRASGWPLALVGQDGAEDLEIPWGEFAAWFVGGSTGWKLSQASADLVGEAKRRGLWAHMGRVNSLTRLRAAFGMGCDSVDGTGMSRWGDIHLRKFVCWVRQLRANAANQPTLLDWAEMDRGHLQDQARRELEGGK